MGELLEEPAMSVELIDLRRLERAVTATGEDFDRIVLAVITEAGVPVGAGYLRKRVGGPRWKLQASLGRLVAHDLVARSGRTSSTRYRRIEGSTP